MGNIMKDLTEMYYVTWIQLAMDMTKCKDSFYKC
jgi:hypothetical protein